MISTAPTYSTDEMCVHTRTTPYFAYFHLDFFLGVINRHTNTCMYKEYGVVILYIVISYFFLESDCQEKTRSLLDGDLCYTTYLARTWNRMQEKL